MFFNLFFIFTMITYVYLISVIIYLIKHICIKNVFINIKLRFLDFILINLSNYKKINKNKKNDFLN